jgi:hypothetical protein
VISATGIAATQGADHRALSNITSPVRESMYWNNQQSPSFVDRINSVTGEVRFLECRGRPVPCDTSGSPMLEGWPAAAEFFPRVYEEASQRIAL